jgi:hypothetical protein
MIWTYLLPDMPIGGHSNLRSDNAPCTLSVLRLNKKLKKEAYDVLYGTVPYLMSIESNSKYEIGQRVHSIPPLPLGSKATRAIPSSGTDCLPSFLQHIQKLHVQFVLELFRSVEGDSDEVQTVRVFNFLDTIKAIIRSYAQIAERQLKSLCITFAIWDRHHMRSPLTIPQQTQSFLTSPILQRSLASLTNVSRVKTNWLWLSGSEGIQSRWIVKCLLPVQRGDYDWSEELCLQAGEEMERRSFSAQYWVMSVPKAQQYFVLTDGHSRLASVVNVHALVPELDDFATSLEDRIKSQMPWAPTFHAAEEAFTVFENFQQELVPVLHSQLPDIFTIPESRILRMPGTSTWHEARVAREYGDAAAIRKLTAQAHTAAHSYLEDRELVLRDTRTVINAYARQMDEIMSKGRISEFRVNRRRPALSGLTDEDVAILKRLMARPTDFIP